jgi:3',5'-cyclic AMP phosphodiesterase CpdA
MTRPLRTFFFCSAILLKYAAHASEHDIHSINGTVGSPASTGDFVFVVAGDNRPTAKGAPLPRVLKTLFDEVRVIRPDFVLWTGDTVYGYDDSPEELTAEYDAFAKLASASGVPLFNAPGNHEIHGAKPCTASNPEEQFKSRFGALYGSFDYWGVHFIALDTEQCGHTTSDQHIQVIDGEQLDWLTKDLEAHKGARGIFVFFHTEVTPAMNDEDGANHKALGNSGELKALFKQYSVKAVFQGHEHLFYQAPDEDGVKYYVAGGAGAPLYARPEMGGFSHYLVVQMKNNNPVVTVVEPGHLYIERGTHGHAAWLVNSSDTPLPVRHVDVTVPASTGRCAELFASTSLTTWDNKPIPVPVEVTTCTSTKGKRTLTLTVAGDVPRRSSVPIDVRSKRKRN